MLLTGLGNLELRGIEIHNSHGGALSVSGDLQLTMLRCSILSEGNAVIASGNSLIKLLASTAVAHRGTGLSVTDNVQIELASTTLDSGSGFPSAHFEAGWAGSVCHTARTNRAPRHSKEV